MKPGRNELCPCGSGRKYKICCGARPSGPAASAPSGNAVQFLQKAVEAHQANRPDEAERLYREVLAREPRNFHARHMLGVVLAQTGRVALGAEMIAAAIALEPNNAEAHNNLGNLLNMQRRFADARQAYETAVAQKPDYVAAHNNLGLLHLGEGRTEKAIACFRRTIELDPDFAAGVYNLAVTYQAQGRAGEAIAAYRRVIEIVPGYAEAHHNLAVLLRAGGKQEEAIESFRRANRATPTYMGSHLVAARTFMARGEVAAAEEILRQAIALEPRNPDIHAQFGEILAEQGRFSEAEPHFAKAIALEPRLGGAYHGLAQSRKATEADRPMIARMLTILTRRDLDDENRAMIHFALGKVLDDLGTYDRAIRHFDEGNRLRRQSRPFDRDAHAAEVDRIVATFTPDFFARNAGLGSEQDLPLLIVGMMRSGTTLTEQIVARHPQVAGAGELEFWRERLWLLGGDAAAAERLDAGMASELVRSYVTLLRRFSPDALRVTDKMPHNFLRLGLIHLLFPQTRIIHCRRNPVDIALSIYFTPFSAAHPFAYDRGDIVFYYRQYERLMEHWRAVLPQDRFLEIAYEDVVAAPGQAARRLIAFSGLDWDDACLGGQEPGRPILTASKWQARQPIYKTSVARWRHYEPWLGAMRELLDDA
jgi:tetratricopeptide (TPR) repeat protein